MIFITPIAGYAEEIGMEPFMNQSDIECIRLKVLTLNIHGAINWSGSYDLDGLIHFIKEIDPDIVGLQEVNRVWSSVSQFQDIPGELALRLNMYPIFSISLERNYGNFGNLILSKHPVVQIWTAQLPGSLETRSFSFAQVFIKGIRVNFLTTHLGLSTSDRLLQTAKIIEFSNQIEGPLIITGDFNGGSSDLAVANLKQHFIDIQEMSEWKDQGTFRMKDGTISTGTKMDYILTTPEFGISKIQIVDNYISDHLPVVAEIFLQVAKTEIAGGQISVQ